MEPTEPTHQDPTQTPAEASAVEPQMAEIVDLPPPPSVEDALRARVSELESRLREVSKAYTDHKGEMEDFRRRQKVAAQSDADRKAFTIVQSFFDPIQNLRRSVEHGAQDPTTLVQGLGMVLQQFTSTMERLGLEEVPGVGAPFDPSCHEALAAMPCESADQDGLVLMVHSTGYRMRGKTLQPAQVVVGKYTEPAEA